MTTHRVIGKSSGRWSRKLALAGLLLTGLAIALYWALANTNSSNAGLLSYSNPQHGYQIQYPSGWTVDASPTQCDDVDRDFCTQATELRSSSGDVEVYVFVNFQGGWCENLLNPVTSEIRVAGQLGKEYRCPGFTIREFHPGTSLIRYFPNVSGHNFLVLGQAKADLSEVSPVVESFTFIN